MNAKNRGSASAPTQVVQAKVSNRKLPRQKVAVDLYFTKNRINVLQKMAEYYKEKTLNSFVQNIFLNSVRNSFDYPEYFGEKIADWAEKKFNSEYPVNEKRWTPDNDMIKLIKLPITLSLNMNQIEVIERLCDAVNQDKSEFIIREMNTEIPGLIEFGMEENGRFSEADCKELLKQWELNEKEEAE